MDLQIHHFRLEPDDGAPHREVGVVWEDWHLLALLWRLEPVHVVHRVGHDLTGPLWLYRLGKVVRRWVESWRVDELVGRDEEWGLCPAGVWVVTGDGGKEAVDAREDGEDEEDR